jgi:integrase
VKKRRGLGGIYRRATGIWWITYNTSKRRHRESSASTDPAVATRLLRQRIKDVESGRLVGNAVDRIRLGEMLDVVIADYTNNNRRSIARAKLSYAHLVSHFGIDTPAINVTEATIERFKAANKEAGYANATTNRSLSFLKRGFRLCRKLLSSIPDIHLLDESSNVREGFLSHDEFLRLCERLPGDLQDPIKFLYFSAWRPTEMRTLHWKDVSLADGVIRLRSANSKNKKPRILPLRGELKEIIERAAQARRLDIPFVFHRDGRQIGSFRKSWTTACREAGLKQILTYDLRRSGIWHMIRSGADQKTAMMISGHKTINTFQRYNIIDEQDLVRALERRDQYLSQQPTGTSNVVQLKGHSSREG